MTQRTLPFAAALAFAALPAFAQDASRVPDVNGDGSWSMEEIAAAVPDLTAETYAAIDGGVITPAG